MKPTLRGEPVVARFERLQRGESPRVLDLFSGCGGFSLGFQRAGCTILGGVEVDPDAARSHALNFHADDLRFEVFARARDITKQSPIEVLAEFAPGLPPQRAVDLLIGGPPCPAFARVGRAKLREIRRHPQAFLQDPRAQLYLPYLKWVEALIPLGIVMENVPDVLNFGGHNLGEEICEALDELGYECAYTLLNAANYGVPELRQRFVLIGWHRGTGLRPEFPEPTHHVDLPPGYSGAIDVALRPLRDTAGRPSGWVPSPGQEHLDPVEDRPVSARDAIGDLPPITGHLTGGLGRGRRDLDASIPRRSHRASAWVRENMLAWPGLPPDDGAVRGHVIRALSNRDFRLFERMAPDEQYPEAWRHAHDLLDEWLSELKARGLELGDERAETRRLASAATGLATELSLATTEHSARVAGARQRWSSLQEDVFALSRARRILLAALPALRTEAPGSEAVISDDLEDRWRAVLASLSPGGSVPRDPEIVREAGRVKRVLSARTAWRDALVAMGETDRRTDRDLVTDALAAVVDGVPPSDRGAEAGPQTPLFTPAAGPRAAAVLIAGFVVSLDLFLSVKSRFVPPYDPSKFPNKWRKMNPDQPARTLMAHLGKDSYSHIHYDGTQARTISVREAARLQSFPDGFRFAGTMNPGFRQVGNAVPPLLSFAIGRRLVEQVRAEPVPVRQAEADPRTAAG